MTNPTGTISYICPCGHAESFKLGDWGTTGMAQLAVHATLEIENHEDTRHPIEAREAVR